MKNYPWQFMDHMKCNTPIIWDNPVGRAIIRLEFSKGNGRSSGENQTKLKDYSRKVLMGPINRYIIRPILLSSSL